MKVEPTSPRPSTAVRKTAGGGTAAAGAGGFAKALNETQSTHTPQMPVSVGFTDMGAVLALQEAPDATTRKRGRSDGAEPGSFSFWRIMAKASMPREPAPRRCFS